MSKKRFFKTGVPGKVRLFYEVPEVDLEGLQREEEIRSYLKAEGIKYLVLWEFRYTPFEFLRDYLGGRLLREFPPRHGVEFSEIDRVTFDHHREIMESREQRR